MCTLACPARVLLPNPYPGALGRLESACSPNMDLPRMRPNSAPAVRGGGSTLMSVVVESDGGDGNNFH